MSDRYSPRKGKVPKRKFEHIRRKRPVPFSRHPFGKGSGFRIQSVSECAQELEEVGLGYTDDRTGRGRYG